MSTTDDTKTVFRFGDCTLAKLERTFALQQVDSLAALTSWCNQVVELTTFEKETLRFYQQGLKQNVHDWNEIELLQSFIGPVFALVNFTTKKFNLFSERAISSLVGGIELKGEPDGMIASGMREPETPYFCFQEYKKFKNPDGDAAGQCLAAMLVAQELNKTKYPVYGCFVIGYDWVFMVLQDKEYAMSTPYVAVRDDIFDIFRILKGLKQIITELVDKG